MLTVPAMFDAGRHAGFDVTVARIADLGAPIDRLELQVVIGPRAEISPSPFLDHGTWRYAVWRNGPGLAVLRDTLAQPALLPAALDWRLAHHADPHVLRYQIVDAIAQAQPVSLAELLDHFDGWPARWVLTHLAALHDAVTAGLITTQELSVGDRESLWLTDQADTVPDPARPDTTGYAAFRTAAAELIPAQSTMAAPAIARASFAAPPVTDAAAAGPDDAPTPGQQARRRSR